MIIVLTSYFNIILAILRIRSSEGRQKVFSTCASHMMAVTVFYGTLLFMYLQPRINHSLDTDKMALVFYTLVIPMLNPLVYSLRTGMTQRDGMGREEGGGFRMGNTCIPVADSFRYLAKPIQYCKV